MNEVPDCTDVIDAANYAPLSSFFENDNDFLTSLETRCLKVQLNLSMWLV